MPAETPAFAAMRETLESENPTSWMEAMVASINCRRRISSMPSLGNGQPRERVSGADLLPASGFSYVHQARRVGAQAVKPPETLGGFILVDQPKKTWPDATRL